MVKQSPQKKNVWNMQFEIISNRFDKSVTGSYDGYGIKIFP